MASAVSKGEPEVWRVTQETIAVGVWGAGLEGHLREQEGSLKNTAGCSLGLTVLEADKQKGSWTEIWKA